jgi:hypothetical protein
MVHYKVNVFNIVEFLYFLNSNSNVFNSNSNVFNGNSNVFKSNSNVFNSKSKY